MANRVKDTVEYFPFYVKDGRTLYVMQKKYGLSGMGFFMQVMRWLGMQPGHYYAYAEDFDKDRFNDFVGMSESDVRTYIGDMVRTGKLDEELWEERSVIYCQDFVDGLEELYRKRTTEIPTREMVLDETASYCRNIREPAGKRGNTPEYDVILPEAANKSSAISEQSKVKESRVKESKEGTPLASDATAPDPGGGISPMKDELANQYQNAFISQTPAEAWKSIPQERKHLVDLAKRTRRLSEATATDPGDMAALIMDRFEVMRNTERGSFWKTAAFTPSSLTARWDAVIESLRKQHEAEEVMVF